MTITVVIEFKYPPSLSAGGPTKIQKLADWKSVLSPCPVAFEVKVFHPKLAPLLIDFLWI